MTKRKTVNLSLTIPEHLQPVLMNGMAKGKTLNDAILSRLGFFLQYGCERRDVTGIWQGNGSRRTVRIPEDMFERIKVMADSELREPANVVALILAQSVCSGEVIPPPYH
ncbi:hypothetical protein PU634_10315 [Oceanimonas pelagia]|uniref:Uncharacterized protein n=1 Tax=Oceanimonas pelagia TaxID=3028314 RepID=A0AA50KL29_9GAMM|nr:hypothetical protein [Oceanimonas pelagia]WMC09509.1 hypothetical protein PU634_10315 [Oceanimonas pelagia]